MKRDGVLRRPGRRRTGPGSRASSGPTRIFQERGYRARLLAAAYRHHLHWSELVGGDVVLTIPHAWQVLFNESGIEVVPRIDDPVAEPIVAELYDRLPDFRRAYDPDGMTVDEFDSYGATVRTLRGFIALVPGARGDRARRHAPRPGRHVAPRPNGMAIRFDLPNGVHLRPLEEADAEPLHRLVSGESRVPRRVAAVGGGRERGSRRISSSSARPCGSSRTTTGSSWRSSTAASSRA